MHNLPYFSAFVFTAISVQILYFLGVKTLRGDRYQTSFRLMLLFNFLFRMLKVPYYICFYILIFHPVLQWSLVLKASFVYFLKLKI